MEDFQRYIEENGEILLDELIRLCRIPSVRGSGAALRDAADQIAGYFRETGARTELHEIAGAPPVVYAEIGEGPRTLLVYNHYDVQPADPLDLWKADPFSPRIADGRLYCRGANDNKGNLMARIHAVRACIGSGRSLPLKLKFIVEGEEEAGSPNLRSFAEKNAAALRADGCLWELSWKDPCGRPIISCGVKGLCYVELRVRGASHDMHSSMASIVPNPAWRLVWALATLLDPAYRITVDGWLDEVRPVTPVEEKVLERAFLDAERLKGIYGLGGFIRGMEGKELVREYLCAPTCTICGLRAGFTGEGSTTVLPSEAIAKLDFRLVPEMTPARLLPRLRRHLDDRGFKDVEIKFLSGTMPAKTDCDDEIVTAAAEALEEVCRCEPIIYPMAPWSGPLHDLCETLKIPSVAFGIGNAESHDHAPNENIRLEDYWEGIRCMEAFMRIYAGRGKGR